ncbi:pseudouridylate synthase I [Saccharomonospora marina XMU15]|uniref:tRNA pseudouridine synthase A n=1 Tax=Saccharomonospora marina XMU15 TaxID=882083 RepID=H5X6D5_9PSEU|nr:tRNA pseudouridine(38-40) synthase TruA [Saccharomonospora marina]EHR49020.1 pseudouridylate synthase I [Saccharomonospora marina XMU15]
MNEPAGPAVDGGLVRIRLGLAYDGTDFSGWAKQPRQRTVQGVIEEALAKQPPGEAMVGPMVVAGRTDAGVHATAQVAHVDASRFAGKTLRGLAVDEQGVPDLARLRHRWNRILPPDVRVLAADVAPTGFDARFSAMRRHYLYKVSDAPWGVDPLRRRDTLAWPRALAVETMNKAAHYLIGLHDFAAFCKQREGATTIRHLQRLSWRRVDEHEIHAIVSADAFCHSMVRSLVGVLLLVGDGRRSVASVAESLRSRQRDSAVAPPHGLTLIGVDYPPAREMAARANETRNIRSAHIS